MFILDILSWWYTSGWVYLYKRMLYRFNWVMQVFSVTALIKTLFAPFRQTDVGKVIGSPGVKFRAFIDRTISRIIGFLVRSILIITALVVLTVTLVINIIIMVSWPFVPFIPIIGLILAVTNFSHDLSWIFHIHPSFHLPTPDFHINGGGLQL